MNRMMRMILLACVCLLTGWTALHAQKRALSARHRFSPITRYTVSVEPLLLFNGGLRVNMEKRVKPGQWVGLCLTGYRLSANDDYAGWQTFNSGFTDFKKLNGVELGGTYKYHFLPGLFAGAKLSYAFYDVMYTDPGFHAYQEDGLTFYEYGQQDTHQHFNKPAANACVGWHTFRHRFFLEMYFGIGYSCSFYNKDKRSFNDIFGFGYKGLYPVFGLKMGLNLP